MATANAALQDQAIDRAHDLHRFEVGVVQRIVAVLNRTDTRLTAQLAEALMQLDRDSFTVQRLEALLASVRQVNAQAYQAVMAAIEPEMQGLAKAQSASELAQLKAAVPAAVRLQFPIAGVAWEQVYAAALSRPFQGRSLKDWAASLEQARMTVIRNTVTAGYVEGQTTAEIIQKVRGTRALRYADGALNLPRQQVAAVVQTALSHTAQTARQASYEANADLVKAVRWVSTLDNRTTPMCRVRDGLRYSADTHKPLDSSIPWGDGPGRLHFNCRSVSVPILKSWRELGINVDDLPASTRASMDGQVPADMTYSQWFLKQSDARQRDILGAKRFDLWKAGKVKIDQFYNDRGRWLSLAELLARIG